MSRVKKYLVKTVNSIHVLFVRLAMLFMVIMTIITSTNVFLRYVLDTGFTWAEEVSKLLVVWFTFIAMAIGVKQELHISIHILSRNLPKWLEIALVTLKHLVIMCVSLFMLRYGIELIAYTSNSIMPATEWPGSTLYIILPVAAILILSEVILDMLSIDDSSEELGSNFSERGQDA